MEVEGVGGSIPAVQGAGGSLEPKEPGSQRYGTCGGTKYARNYNCMASQRRAFLTLQGSLKTSIQEEPNHFFFF